MSPLSSILARALLLAAVVTATAVAPASAESPARNVRYELPSLKGNVDAARVQFNQTDRLTAWVRFPAGYDDQPNREWPVLYLLHGWEDNADAWINPKKGAIDKVLPADFEGIVVMPEGAKAWFVNWADQKANPGSRWGDYLLDEVVPFMEDELRIKPGRANHTIGGLSMGGYGSLRAAAALPSYFGAVLSFSSLLDPQDLSFASILGIAQFGKSGYGAVFGPLTGAYANAVNPLQNTREFKNTRMSVYYGTPNPLVLLSLDIRARGIATLEVGAQAQARRFVDALKKVGVPSVFANNRPNMSHDWPWWKLDLLHAYRRGLFVPTGYASSAEATAWDYGTIAQHGNAWGLGYRFAAQPTKEVEFTRSGQTLIARGTGTVTIEGGAQDWDASGAGTLSDCRFTLKLPFTTQLPAGC